MNDHRRRRLPWQRSRSGGNHSSSERPPEYVHPLDSPPDGDDPVWEGPPSDPFEAPQTTRLVPVGPARPTRRRTDDADSADDQQGPRPDDADDAQSPVFAADTMRALETPQPYERARFVSHGGDRPRFAPPDGQPVPRPPASVADQRLGPTPRAGMFAPPAVARTSDAAGREQQATANAAPPWVSTSRARPAAVAPTSLAGPGAQAEVLVRIELVITDQSGQVSPARNVIAASGAAASGEPASQGGADAAAPGVPTPAPGVPTPTPEMPAPTPEVRAPTPTARSSAPIRAAVRIVGVIALVGIGLFLVQLGVWLAR